MSAADPTSDGGSPLDPTALQDLVAAAVAAVSAAADLEQLKAARLAHVEGRSPLAAAKRAIGGLEPGARAEAGKRWGAAIGQVQQAMAQRTAALEAERDERVLREETVDVTLLADRRPVGARHPVSTLGERIGDLFVAMGWEVVEGPEVETEWLNFDALNFDPDHPARQMQDTFFVADADGGADSGLVMRTHTSPLQARALLERGAPLYVAAPGKVFRTDELDATHTPVFHQVEGLAVDEGLTMGHLRGVLDHLAAALFGPGARTRLRPSFFPFTEPSAEMDVWFERPDGSGGTTGRWIEWGGCGMVNPNVLRSVGVDPDRYTGFAFGMGIDRAVMFRHGVADMHDMVEGDVRFSARFGMES